MVEESELRTVFIEKYAVDIKVGAMAGSLSGLEDNYLLHSGIPNRLIPEDELESFLKENEGSSLGEKNRYSIHSCTIHKDHLREVLEDPFVLRHIEVVSAKDLGIHFHVFVQ